MLLEHIVGGRYVHRTEILYQKYGSCAGIILTENVNLPDA